MTDELDRQADGGMWDMVIPAGTPLDWGFEERPVAPEDAGYQLVEPARTTTGSERVVRSHLVACAAPR